MNLITGILVCIGMGVSSSWAITGRVLERALNAPVPGATIQILGGCSTQTDSAGRFEIPTSAARLIVSKEKLLSRTVNFEEGQSKLGDIVLDYPPRALDIGAKPPYGAEILFDGSQGAAAAEKEMQANWKPWWRFDTAYQKGGQRPPVTDITFKIANDPKFPTDSLRASMRSCCSEDHFWGYHDLQSKKAHGDVQWHIEWIGMGEFNSGIYVQSRYELQILSGAQRDNHSVGSIVREYRPSANPMRANGQWQAYDITFRTARYRNGNTQGPGDTLAMMSVWWNGVLIHLNRKVKGVASGLANHSGEEMNAVLYGLKMQNESGDVRFRNIWMKPLKIDTLGTNFGY